MCLLLFSLFQFNNCLPSYPTSKSVSKTDNFLQLLKCVRYLRTIGNRITLSSNSQRMILMNDEGKEVMCDESGGYLQVRAKSDRSCQFSPIHCLFKKRLQNNNRVTNYY
ncbi:unnamed protein product [Caenorhabditis angaria]|uniref:Uncharacterized protein n=1 Tax=Caenorhabditis angaria TaxID=860376 RepID=A0A9P1MVM8_9PELO|nr:unnamed protein product [Caenorhabditis angaria]